MRSDYYKFIQQHSISDILSEIDILSYSKKQDILEYLVSFFTSETINMALNQYKINYIDAKRIDVKRLHNILLYFCNQNKENV